MEHQIDFMVSDVVWEALRKEADISGKQVTDVAKLIVIEWAMRNEIFKALTAQKS